LTDIEVEKLKGLSEGVGFEDADQYRNSLETIRENYFQKTSSGKKTVIDEESEITESVDGAEEAAPTTPQMAAYVNTLGRTVVEKR
jgi:predicted metalloendopeptidase